MTDIDPEHNVFDTASEDNNHERPQYLQDAINLLIDSQKMGIHSTIARSLIQEAKIAHLNNYPQTAISLCKMAKKDLMRRLNARDRGALKVALFSKAKDTVLIKLDGARNINIDVQEFEESLDKAEEERKQGNYHKADGIIWQTELALGKAIEKKLYLDNIEDINASTESIIHFLKNYKVDVSEPMKNVQLAHKNLEKDYRLSLIYSKNALVEASNLLDIYEAKRQSRRVPEIFLSDEDIEKVKNTINELEKTISKNDRKYDMTKAELFLLKARLAFNDGQFSLVEGLIQQTKAQMNDSINLEKMKEKERADDVQRFADDLKQLLSEKEEKYDFTKPNKIIDQALQELDNNRIKEARQLLDEAEAEYERIVHEEDSRITDTKKNFDDKLIALSKRIQDLPENLDSTSAHILVLDGKIALLEEDFEGLSDIIKKIEQEIKIIKQAKIKEILPPPPKPIEIKKEIKKSPIKKAEETSIIDNLLPIASEAGVSEKIIDAIQTEVETAYSITNEKQKEKKLMEIKQKLDGHINKILGVEVDGAPINEAGGIIFDLLANDTSDITIDVSNYDIFTCFRTGELSGNDFSHIDTLIRYYFAQPIPSIELIVSIKQIEMQENKSLAIFSRVNKNEQDIIESIFPPEIKDCIYMDDGSFVSSTSEGLINHLFSITDRFPTVLDVTVNNSFFESEFFDEFIDILLEWKTTDK
jgi:hypothetical protein